MAEKAPKEELKVDAIILHSDGSCVPNPGQGGWGFHGFAFSNEPPKKGSGNPDYYVTNEGYVEKTMLDAFRKGKDPYEKIDFTSMKEGTDTILDQHMLAKEVTPLFYVDDFGPAPKDHRGLSTNNIGEIVGFTKALEFAIKEDIRIIRIYADSQYTLDGWNKALKVWARNGWRRRDGMVIQNVEAWEHLWKLKQQTEGWDIVADWLPGHSIFLGNQLADMNANLGKNMTIAGLDKVMTDKQPAQGYWKVGEVDKHPLVCHQKLFFNADLQYHESGRYYMGAVDKDLGLFGKRLSDSAYSVIQLNKPIESLESLIKHHSELSGGDNQMVVGHMSAFFKPTVYKQFTEYGTFSLYQINTWSDNLSSADKQLVTEVLDPPKKSLEAVLAMNNISMWLNEWLEQKPEASRFTATDLTPHLYETSVVTKKNKDVSVTKLKASIIPGTGSISVDANYRDAQGAELVLPTILTFGVDLTDRNGLKRIEEQSPKVTLLTWEESPGVFRYFTVIQVEDDVGAYCGYYSNTRLNKVAKKKSNKKD